MIKNIAGTYIHTLFSSESGSSGYHVIFFPTIVKFSSAFYPINSVNALKQTYKFIVSSNKVKVCHINIHTDKSNEIMKVKDNCNESQHGTV